MTDMEPKPWLVEGTVRMAGRFSLCVDAPDRETAERMVKGFPVIPSYSQYGMELTDICVELVEPIEVAQ